MKQYRRSFITITKDLAKRILKPCAIGRLVYPVVRGVYRHYAIPAKRRRLHKYGYRALARMHKVFSDNAIPYYCDAGTLLGFIRDGGFIKNDDDIDVCVMPGSVPLSKVLKCFLDNGYGFIHAFDYKGRFLEFSIMDQDNIPIDVFLHEPCADDNRFLHEIFLRWFPDRQYPNDRANSGLLFKLRGPDGLKMMTIHGVEVSVPSNAKEILDSEYGPWQNPDPNFNSEQIEHTELPDFVFRITKESALQHI